MVITSYQCPALECFAELVTVVTREAPRTDDSPPICPWCCVNLVAAPAELASHLAPAAADAGEDFGDAARLRAADELETRLTEGADQVNAPAPAGSDQVTHGHDRPERRGFEPPRLRVLPRDDFHRRRTDRVPEEPDALRRLRETGDAEGPSEHLRNALQILAGILSYDGALLQDPDEATVAQMAARLVRAGEQLPIGGDVPAGALLSDSLVPFVAFRDAVRHLVTSAAAHQDQARAEICHTGQLLRFALNSLLAALGPGTAPVPPAIAAAYAGVDVESSPAVTAAPAIGQADGEQ